MGGFTPLSCVLPLPHNPRSKSLNLDSLQRGFVVWVYNKIVFEGEGIKVDSSRLFPVAPPIGAHAPLEMSSSVLPAALKRRRMGLADGLDIGSLLSYGFLITRRELRSSVG